MDCFRSHTRIVAVTIAAAAGVLLGAWQSAQAGAVPYALRHSFSFPVSVASGATGDLVSVPGSNAHLTFDRGMVAIGHLPVPRSERATRGERAFGTRFARPADGVPRVRLLLSGVVDADGNRVTSAGNTLMIDAVVSPTGAAVSPPPFVIPFDLSAGAAFVDAPLPIEVQGGATVRVQILGAAVIDPEGQPFGVLGFSLPPAPPASALPALTPGWTPTTVRTPAEGHCFVGPSCTRRSVPAARDICCRLDQGNRAAPALPASWCSADQFDPSTGQCAAGGCDNCLPPPTPTPPPIGRICWQCTEPTPSCLTLSLGDVQPTCPPGCTTFVQQECDPRSDTCVPPMPCSTDPDCDDGNGCTVDRCIAGACTHDCVCVGPMGCSPGPTRR